MQNIIDQLLFLIGLSNLILLVFYIFLIIGLVMTRIKSGNTITLGMIVERIGLAIFFAWNIWVTMANTSFIEYTQKMRLYTLSIRLMIAILLIGSVWYMLRRRPK